LGAPSVLERFELGAQELQLHRLLPDQQLELQDVLGPSQLARRCHAIPARTGAVTTDVNNVQLPQQHVAYRRHYSRRMNERNFR